MADDRRFRDCTSTSFRSFEASISSSTEFLDLGQDPLEISQIGPNVSLFCVQQFSDALPRSLVYQIRLVEILKRDYRGD